MIRTTVFAGLMLGLMACGALSPAAAGKADVIEAAASKSAPGIFDFSVTVRHADEGWKHYANKWEVVGPGGKVLATRVLYHPHVTEQPFTRSLSGVKIPASVTEVTVRAGDTVHGLGGREVKVKISHN
ncbi:MAG TPA: hypothetical protein VMX97_01005 [Hyphomicrobiaceae bacterium]|nr:hypothetical protein [Hyphomicrobiaceae bacterium]